MLLKTDRLLIRELTPDDWKFMQKIAADFQEIQIRHAAAHCGG